MIARHTVDAAKKVIHQRYATKKRIAFSARIVPCMVKAGHTMLGRARRRLIRSAFCKLTGAGVQLLPQFAAKVKADLLLISEQAPSFKASRLIK